MKQSFFLLLFCLLSIPSQAQFTGIHFDKTRCQTLTVLDQIPFDFPTVYSNDKVNQFCQNYLHSNKADPNAILSLWKKESSTFQFIRQQKLQVPIAFPILTPSTYIAISNDLLKPLLLEIKITNSYIQTNIYYNCSIHY